MMKTYARLAGTRVLFFEYYAEPPAGLPLVSEDKIDWPPTPTGHILHLVDGSLMFVDGRTLAQAQAAKWEQVKGWREAAVNADMDTPFGVIQCRPEDRSNISDAVTLANSLHELGLPVAITWTLADNTAVTLSRTQMIQVGLLLGQRVQTAYGRGRVLRDQLGSATTIAEVDAIQWLAA